MARYSSLIGKRIEVNYRARVIHPTATGTLVADTGATIYLEERFTQRGKEKTLRLGIPHSCIIHLAEVPKASEASDQAYETAALPVETSDSRRS